MKKPLCALVQPWIVRLENRVLDPVRSRWLASHLAGCEECRQEWEAQVALGELLRSRADVGPESFDRIWESLAPLLPAVPAPPRRRAALWAGVGTMAGALTVAGFLWVQRDRFPQDSFRPEDVSLAGPPARKTSSVGDSRDLSATPGSVQRALKSVPEDSGNRSVPIVRSVGAKRVSLAAAPRQRLGVETDRKQSPPVSRRRSDARRPEVVLVRNQSVGDKSADTAARTVAWQEGSSDETSPMEAVQQASLSRSLFH
jgi:hypothetical protein